DLIDRWTEHGSCARVHKSRVVVWARSGKSLEGLHVESIARYSSCSTVEAASNLTAATTFRRQVVHQLLRCLPRSPWCAALGRKRNQLFGWQIISFKQIAASRRHLENVRRCVDQAPHRPNQARRSLRPVSGLALPGCTPKRQ